MVFSLASSTSGSGNKIGLRVLSVVFGDPGFRVVLNVGFTVLGAGDFGVVATIFAGVDAFG